MKKAYRPLFVALAIAASVFVGTKLVPSDHSMIFSSKSMSGIFKLNDILNYIEESYVDTVEKDQLIEDGIQSMLKDLDPHSFYIPKSDFQGVQESLEGNFEGIGIEFRIITDTVMVITTVPLGPSEKAGLKSGDRLIMVNDSVIAGSGVKNAGVIKLLKGEQFTKVNVAVKRKNEKELLKFDIIRDKIPLLSVQSPYMINRNTGYIRVSRFSKTTHAEFITGVDKLLETGMKNLVIDMRNNPGGLLNEAIKMSNEFLSNNKVIVYTEGKSRPKKIYYADNSGSLLHIELVVLLDEGSASASEVFAGAIQDNDRGMIVGRRSFGKGLVQEQIDWKDGSALRLTVARYYTPTGRSIQKPYKNVENYHMETFTRLENGELDSKDSIHVVDSLKFRTAGGRVVYGGGGIVPDVFIPVDTLNYNTFYNNLYKHRAIQNYTFKFVDERRKTLLSTYPTWKVFDSKYQISESEFEVFLQFAAKQGVERNPRQIALMKSKIKLDLKAQYARHLYGEEGFYPIVNHSDPSIQKSIGLFK